MDSLFLSSSFFFFFSSFSFLFLLFSSPLPPLPSSFSLSSFYFCYSISFSRFLNSCVDENKSFETIHTFIVLLAIEIFPFRILKVCLHMFLTYSLLSRSLIKLFYSFFPILIFSAPDFSKSLLFFCFILFLLLLLS